jgi:hypothetical protein
MLIVAAGCADESPGDPAPSSISPSNSASTSGGSDAGGSYDEQITAIDDEWQAGVDSAFEGREYLRTGALPDDFEPTTEALNNFLAAARGNLEQLVEVTGHAREQAEALEVPEDLATAHADYVAVVTDFGNAWAGGLSFIEEEDAEGFLRFYVTFQPIREALEQRLDDARSALD